MFINMIGRFKYCFAQDLVNSTLQCNPRLIEKKRRAQKVRTFIKNVNPDLLTDLLMKVYSVDYEMFGYEIPNIRALHKEYN